MRTWASTSTCAICLVISLVAVSLSHLVPSDSVAGELDSSFTFREAFLPPGVPSVALRDDETAMLWNPGGLAMTPVYYVGYAWKGTYLGDERRVATHFALTKAKGFAIGFSRDDHSEGVKNTVLVSIAPRVSKSFGVGFTGKWKGGFNFDCGTMVRLGRRISVGFVGRNLRDREEVRRYWESGLGIYAIPGRLKVFFDVIEEDSPWRKATAYGGGFAAYLEYGISVCSSYFTDGEDVETLRASLQLAFPARLIEGEYSTATDDWKTLSARISYHNP